MFSAKQMLGLILVLLAAVPLHAAEPKAEDLVKATLIADATSIQPGKTFNIGVLLKISPHWHVYWSNSGDAGIPTTVEFHLPLGFTASRLEYPVPIRIEQSGGIVMYGYSDEVMLLAKVTAPAHTDSSNVTIEANLNYLVCDENTCIPGSAKLKLGLPAGAEAKANQPELFKTWISRIPVPAAQSDLVANSQTKVSIRSAEGPKTTGEISISIDWKGDSPKNVEWFPPARDGIQFGRQQVQSTGSSTTITIPFERFGLPKPESAQIESVVAVMTAKDRMGITLPVTMSDTGR